MVRPLKSAAMQWTPEQDEILRAHTAAEAAVPFRRGKTPPSIGDGLPQAALEAVDAGET